MVCFPDNICKFKFSDFSKYNKGKLDLICTHTLEREPSHTVVISEIGGNLDLIIIYFFSRKN